jgi:ABC-2 type transport system permease protein
MAVHKHTYKDYTGPRTPSSSRFLVLARFGFARVFHLKFLSLFIVGCLFGPLLCAAYIYLSHNAPFLALFSIPADRLPAVDGRFFYFYSIVQGALAYLLTAFVGPVLVTPDFANGAMPLYFSRPFSRAEYVAGRMTVFLTLLSLITWIPGVVLFAIQASIEGWNWMTGNLWLAGAIVLGLLVWIVVLSLIGLALSAWVRWKIGAGALVLGVIFAGAGFGAAINSLMRTNYGALIDLTQVAHTIWSYLFRYDTGTEVSLTRAWIVLGVVSLICLWLLAKRIRPFEIIK